MGYTLKIGEHESHIEEGEEGVVDSYIYHDVVHEKRDDAPAYGEPTDYENSRWPSYSSWSDAMRFIGLYDFMFNKEEGLLREHPGCVLLTQVHKNTIDAAHKNFYLKYPNAKAGYSPKSDDFTEDKDWPIENNYATRLEWLKYWVDWALENCKVPVFKNS